MSSLRPRNHGLLAGAAEVCVTPRLPVELAGYHGVRVAHKVRDDLFCRACVLRSGRTAVAWVSCDVIALPESVITAIRREVARRLRRRPSCMIGATHTHTAPSPVDMLSATVNRRFVAALVKGAAAAVVKAFEKAVPARVGWGTGREATTVFQRRFLMHDGTIKTNPGAMNRDIVRPDGPVDPEVGLLKVQDVRGQPLAAVVTFANHVDTLGLNEISADWPGAMSRRLKRHLGRSLITVFLCGAQGNVNHVNVRRRSSFVPLMTERIGRRVADAVRKAWACTPVASNIRLAAIERPVRFPRRRVAPRELHRARAVLKGVRLPYRVTRPLTSFDLAKGCLEGERLEAQELVGLARFKGRTESSRLLGIAVDRAAWLAVPGEVFVETGLTLKRRSPFRRTFVAGLVNGYLGYMPTDDAFRKGGYETIPARSSRLAPGVEGVLLREGKRLLQDLFKLNRKRNSS
ncbi:MAG: neutral/alkaline non-lysosomal ceramidase N-terminal domain-containing protein [Verrucomicrobiae bacterium]|nr:neutral/alkaline non-lysosomal ceramidase N-terminal domain-containing protein [Verrucomicrobiae bacterium]